MKKAILFFILTFSLKSSAITSLDFVSGSEKFFNQEFVKRFLASSITKFSKTGRAPAELQEEIAFFIDHETDYLFFTGDAGKLKMTKFFLKILVSKKSVKTVYLSLFSSAKTLHTWNLSDFSKVQSNYIGGSKGLPLTCGQLKKEGLSIVYFSLDNKTQKCLAYSVEATLSHPAFKGLVNIVGESKKVQSQIVVKNMFSNLTTVPADVKTFARNWRLPPSRFINKEEENELYIP